MKALTSVLVFVAVLLCFSTFFVLSEMIHRDISPLKCAFRTFSVCLLPHKQYKNIQMIATETTEGSPTRAVSVGFILKHVPFDRDLGLVSDFLVRKICRYSQTKSLGLRHIYVARATFTTSPYLDIQLPKYCCSVFIISLGGPLKICCGKDDSGESHVTSVRARMAAFSKVVVCSNTSLRIYGSFFCYGIFAPITTIDFL